MTKRKSVWFQGRWRTPEGIEALRTRDRERKRAQRKAAKESTTRARKSV